MSVMSAEEWLQMAFKVTESLLDAPGNVPVRWCPMRFNVHFHVESVIVIKRVAGKMSLEPEVPLKSIQSGLQVGCCIPWGWTEFQSKAKERAKVFRRCNV